MQILSNYQKQEVASPAPFDVYAEGENVWEVLLVRDNHFIARNVATKEKRRVELPVVIQFWRGSLQAVDAPADHVPVAAARPAPAKREGESKLDICRRVRAENPGATREQLTRLFIDVAGCTEKGAVTYWHKLKSE